MSAAQREPRAVAAKHGEHFLVTPGGSDKTSLRDGPISRRRLRSEQRRGEVRGRGRKERGEESFLIDWLYCLGAGKIRAEIRDLCIWGYPGVFGVPSESKQQASQSKLYLSNQKAAGLSPCWRVLFLSFVSLHIAQRTAAQRYKHHSIIWSLTHKVNFREISAKTVRSGVRACLPDS